MINLNSVGVAWASFAEMVTHVDKIISVGWRFKIKNTIETPLIVIATKLLAFGIA